jgi:hypothetical protein
MTRNSKGRIIAYSGTHGTGKTTAVYNRIGILKKVNPLSLIGPHVENLPFCPYPINRDSTEESQLWVFTNHIQAELNLLTRYDIVVSDRTAADAIAYTFAFGFNDLAEHMLALASHHIHRYSEIILLTAEGNPHHFDDGFRDSDEPFRLDVERWMFQVYDRLGFDFIETDPGHRLAVRR